MHRHSRAGENPEARDQARFRQLDSRLRGIDRIPPVNGFDGMNRLASRAEGTAELKDGQMPAIVITTEENALLGFLLIARKTLVDGTESDFVFTGLPKDPALLDTPASQFIRDHKNIEYKLTVTERDSRRELSADFQDGWQITLRIPADLTGGWTASHSDGTSLLGHCALAKPSNKEPA